MKSHPCSNHSALRYSACKSRFPVCKKRVLTDNPQQNDGYDGVGVVGWFVTHKKVEGEPQVQLGGNNQDQKSQVGAGVTQELHQRCVDDFPNLHQGHSMKTDKNH